MQIGDSHVDNGGSRGPRGGNGGWAGPRLLAWIAAVAAGYAWLLWFRTALGPVLPTHRPIGLYIFQALLALTAVATALVGSPSPRRSQGLLSALVLLIACGAAETGFLMDAQWLAKPRLLTSVFVVHVLAQGLYFAFLLPWAAGLAIGRLPACSLGLSQDMQDRTRE